VSLKKKKKILLAYGTRPELIKLVPLIYLLRKSNACELLIVNTGQHKEMVDELEKLFSIKPDINFNVMTPNQSPNTVLSEIVGKTTALFSTFKPETVIVQGDTTTVLSIGIAAFYAKINVAHVEAGLRSFDIDNPYPEEFNRRVISLFAKYNFVPTKQTALNLRKEKVKTSTIHITGNTVVDTLRLVLKKLQKKNKGQTDIPTKRKILITAHRRENHEKGIHNICEAVLKILDANNNIEFIWPVHPNPNVQRVVYEKLGKITNVTLCPPLSYAGLVKEMRQSYLIWTDSGGIQEEAPTLKKPVLILRTVTERPEVVDSGFGKLVGTEVEKIVSATNKLLKDRAEYKRMTSGKNPFGDGKAADRIAKILLRD